MKLALLKLDEDVVMQILWKRKRASLPEIVKDFKTKKKPAAAAVKKALELLGESSFAGSVQKAGVTYYFPRKERENNLRFRAQYHLVGYFDGSLKQLENFIMKYEVEGVSVFPSLEDHVGEAIRLSTIRNYYQVHYPKAIISVPQIAAKDAANFRKGQKAPASRFVILAEGKLKNPPRVAFVVASVESLKSYKNFKLEREDKILYSKTTTLHPEIMK